MNYYNRLHLLNCALKDKNYSRFEELLDSKENMYFYMKDVIGSDLFTLILVQKDMTALDLFLKSFKNYSNIENVPSPESYIPHLLLADNVEVYKLLDKHNIFQPLFKDSLSVNWAIKAASPNTLAMLLDEEKVSLETGAKAFKDFCKNILIFQIIKTDYTHKSKKPDANRFEKTIQVINQYDNQFIEKNLVSTMIDLGVIKNTILKPLPSEEVLQEMNSFMSCFIFENFNPFTTLKEHLIKYENQLTKIEQANIEKYPQIKELNFFDLQLFEQNQIELEKKYLDYKLNQNIPNNTNKIKI